MEKIINWFYKPVFTLICYAIALLLFIFCCYSLKMSYDTVVAAVAAGSISWTTDIGEIISYVMTQCSSYIFYTFAFVFFGKVINIIKPREAKAVLMVEDSEEVENLEINEDIKEVVEA